MGMILFLLLGGGFVSGGGGGGTDPLTTKGDIHTFSTVTTRLPVGADGLCLKPLAANATGLEWGTCAAAGGGLTYAESAAASLGGF